MCSICHTIPAAVVENTPTPSEHPEWGIEQHYGLTVISIWMFLCKIIVLACADLHRPALSWNI